MFRLLSGWSEISSLKKMFSFIRPHCPILLELEVRKMFSPIKFRSHLRLCFHLVTRIVNSFTRFVSEEITFLLFLLFDAMRLIIFQSLGQ